MRPIFWNPSTFRPEDTLPLRLLLHCQSARYLMDRIVNKVAHHDMKPARLKMEYLRTAIGRYQCEPLLEALTESGDIGRVGGYKGGSQSFGYLPGNQYLDDKLAKFHPTDARLIERLTLVHQKIEDEQRRYWLPIHDCWERWQHELRIDVRLARRAIAQLSPASNRYGVQDMLVDNIRHHRHPFIVDPYGRVHNSITSLCRSIRPALRMGKQPLAGVDIVNSQPALLAWHLANLPPERGKQSAIIYEEAPPGPLPSPSPGPSRRFLTLATTGRLYEHLMRLTGLDRDAVKLHLMRDVLGLRYPYPSVVGDAFRSEFPEVAAFVLRFNAGDHGNLLRHLQSVESDLVVRRVGRRLNGGCVSLHDSIYTRSDRLDVVLAAFEAEFAESGIRLKLKAA